MNIILRNFTAGMVSIAFVVSAVVATPFASAQTTADLQAQINALLAQLSALEGSSTTTTSRVSTNTVSSTSNAACPYTWTRNLTIGSSGDDVLRLQRFLNGDPRTRVATSGAGSPGNESRYYGPATAGAVSRFQEVNAAQILTPLGLTSGTGGFYTSTRTRANALCASGNAGSNAGVTPPVVNISGDSLAVTAGRHPGDSYAIASAQRVPFTQVVLTAGSQSVDVDSITVERFGLVKRGVFDSISVIDGNGIQVGTSKSLNSRNEARLPLRGLTVPRNSSVTLNIVATVADATGTNAVDVEGVGGLQVTELEADTTVDQSSLPIRGASHSFSDSLALPKLSVDGSDGVVDIELREQEEVSSYTLSLGGSNVDEEDAYLQYVVFEQNGSIDESELDEFVLLVDGDRADYDLSVDGDSYTVVFDGRGLLIEEDERLELSLEVEVSDGVNETISFGIDDTDDVYVVGRDSGYGLPVELNGGDSLTVRETSVARGDASRGRVRGFDDEVTTGDDVVLGAQEFELEGEDLEFEDLEFQLVIDLPDDFTDGNDGNGWERLNIDELVLSNIRLEDADGTNYAEADDVEITEDAENDDTSAFADGITDFTTSETNDDDEIRNGLRVATVEFDGTFEVEVDGERDLELRLVADLDSDWASFDGTEIEFTLVDLRSVEGVVSGESYTTDGLFELNGNVLDSAIDFRSVTVQGTEVDFDFDENGIDDEAVAGTEEVVLGTFEVDADETPSNTDVEVTKVELYFHADNVVAPTGADAEVADTNHLENCAFYDEDDERVSRTIDVSSGTTGVEESFRFNDVFVSGGDTEEYELRCDLSDDAGPSDKYYATADSRATTNVGGSVEYEVVGIDDFTFTFEAPTTPTSLNDNDKVIVSSAGTLRVTSDAPRDYDGAYHISVGDDGERDVEITTFEVEAEREDIEITDVYISVLTYGGFTAGDLDRVLSGATLTAGSRTIGADPDRDLVTEAVTDEDGNDLIDPAPSDTSVALHFEDVNFTVEEGEEEELTLTFDYRGIDENDGIGGAGLTIGGVTFVYEGENSENSDHEEVKSVDEAEVIPHRASPVVSANRREQSLRDGSLTLYEFTVQAPNEGDVYVGTLTFEASIGSGIDVDNVVLREDGSDVELAAGATNDTLTSGAEVFTPAEPVRVRAGETTTFSLRGVVTGAAGDRSIVVQLTEDSSAPADVTGAEFSAVTGNFVWSPNGLDKDGETTDNADWFTGYGLFDSDTVEDWVTERD